MILKRITRESRSNLIGYILCLLVSLVVFKQDLIAANVIALISCLILGPAIHDILHNRTSDNELD